MWTVQVVAVSCGLRETGYAHQVVNGDRTITVTHHTHQNYAYIHKQDLDRTYCRWTGVGRREPDLTPHPEAIAVANALNAL